MTGQVSYYNRVGDTQGGVTTREHFGGELRRPVSRSPHFGAFSGPPGIRSEVLRAQTWDLYCLETVGAYAKPDCQNVLSAQNSPRLVSEGFERLKCSEISDVAQLHVGVSGR